MRSTNRLARAPAPDSHLSLSDPIYTVQAAAHALNVHVRTLERWRQTGEGPSFVRLGRRIGYRLSRLDTWLEANTRQSTSQA
jgi:excisionase family DNA binding protein